MTIDPPPIPSEFADRSATPTVVHGETRNLIDVAVADSFGGTAMRNAGDDAGPAVLFRSDRRNMGAGGELKTSARSACSANALRCIVTTLHDGAITPAAAQVRMTIAVQDAAADGGLRTGPADPTFTKE